MGDKDLDDFTMMLLTLGELYNKNVTPQMISMYFASLCNYSLDDVRMAINLHVRNPDNGQFMPKPADLIRMIDGNTQTQGMKAWTKVLDTIGRAGAYASVCFDDQIIHRVITDMGGWIKLCEIKESETPFVAKEFEKRYQAYANKRATLDSQYPPVLVGISDSQNVARGLKMGQITYVGNSQDALATMHLGRGSGTATTLTMSGALSDVGTAIQRGRLLGIDAKAGKAEREVIPASVSWPDNEAF